MSLKPSAEQQAVVKTIQEGFNVCVDSVAGSGKTTTIEFIIDSCPSLTICVLTFNKGLQNDLDYKLKNKKVKNARSYTFHGFAYQFFFAFLYNVMYYHVHQSYIVNYFYLGLTLHNYNYLIMNYPKL